MPDKHSEIQKDSLGRALPGQKPASRRRPASIMPPEESRILIRRVYSKPKPTRH